MHPIERLRYVARAGDADPGLLAAEAAEALGSLSFDARALVPACRRLLDAHPSCAPLWWVAAHLLVADDVGSEARRLAEALEDDPSGEELAATFPAGSTVVIAPSAVLADAVALRPDLTVLVVGDPYRVRKTLSRIGDRVDALGYGDDEAREAVGSADLLVLETLAGGPSGFLLDLPQTELVAAALDADVELWVMAGVGRLLPSPLFDALRARVQGSADLDPPDVPLRARGGRFGPRSAGEPLEFLDAPLVRAVVGPDGAAAPRAALARIACPAPAELLAPASSH